MGVPKFFRYISERYPCLSEVVRDYQIPNFDNLYLDMNGIIHMCSHPDDADPHFCISEEKIFTDIFHYIEVLFRMILPRKVFFMAIDGVAPRAKMNQQRGRRFCTAKEMEMLEQKAKEKGEALPKQARFDSNCITPGTEFMARLHEQLKYFVVNKVSTDKMWRSCQIILSGQETPGEGEHKIMDYIRYSRAQPGYDPHTRHCLYGLDADLIMLGLCTHEPHISLLREEVRFGSKSKSSKRKSTPETVTFYLLHLSLMREYLELEFFPIKDSLPFEYNIENIIDDWVLMGFLVGNDFIPHLPNMHITKGAITTLYSAYMKVLPTLDGYINESGSLNLARFEKFLAALSEFETEQFRDQLDDIKWFESKTGRRRFGKKAELEKNGLPESEDQKILDLDEVLSTVDIVLDEDDVATDDSCSDESEDEHGVLDSEFTEIKADYYRDKMEYTDVTSEVLRSQAEGYITAIQWNLHYYYNGICSWSWYYPHHYAPCISDIKGFTDFVFDFELGEPFKPYEQLLAVLPAASRTLLPLPYQELMTGDNSPIKDWYPQDFKTDMNGKRNEWEAVVLLPFIEENLLLKAMKSCSHRLTKEENERNRYGPMLIYKYTEQDMGCYEAPSYFPRVIHSHAVCQSKDYSDLRVPTGQLIKGAYPGIKMDVFYPGFPTMKHLKYTGTLEFGEVRVFDYPSKSKNMILHIEPKEFPEIDFIAGELLGKTVFVGWPHLVEAQVTCVSNKEYRYYSAGGEGQYNVEENKGKLFELWCMEKQAVVERYKSRQGIDLSETDHLVHVRTMVGQRYTFTPNGQVSYEKEWSKVQSAFPLQTVVANIKFYEDEHVEYCSINEAFPVGSICFMIGHPQYGSQGKVMESIETMKNGRIKVAMVKQLEPNLSVVQQFERNFQVQYMPLNVAASRLSISKHIFSRITGSIFVTVGSSTAPAASPTHEPRKINVGLNLKFNKKREEVPGYTRHDGVNWLYSSKTVALVHAFMDKFPSLFEYLQNSGGNDIFFEEDVFPNNTGQLKEVITWLKEQPHYSLERVVSGSEFLELELVQKLEQVLEPYNAEKHKVSHVIMQVKPSLLYKSEMQSGNIVPDETATFQLYDRVVNVKEGYSVPLGLKGTVIAINRSNSAKEEDTTYDVLFDEPFLGGMKIHGCSQAQGYRVARSILINISHGQRVFIHKTGKPGQLLNQVTHNKQNGVPKPPIHPYQQPPQFQNWNTQQPEQQYLKQNWRSGNTVPPPLMQVPYSYPGFPVQLSQPNRFVPYKTCNYPAPSEVPGSGGVQQKQLQQPRNMFMPSFGTSQGPLSPQSPKKCNVKVLSNNSININVPSPSINNNTPNLNIQPSMPDTESLKKILKISDVENKDEVTRISWPTKPHVNSISVNDLFAHARAKEQTQPPSNTGIQCATPATVRLWNYFQTINLGLPQYQYIELPCGSWQTQLKLPKGLWVYTDSASTTREEAAEKAAVKALDVLNIKVEDINPPQPPTATVPNPPERWCRNPAPFAPESKPERFTTSERRERQLVAQRHIFAHLGIRPKNTAEQPLTPQTPPRPNSNLNPNSSPFIPLQAMKPRSKPTLVQQKLQKEDINAQGARYCDSSSSKSAPQLQETNLEVSDKPKRERKMRIAANFTNVPS